MAISTVGVVGAGTMGSGIIEVLAKAGCRVVAREVDAGAAEAGRARVEGSLAKAVERGKLDEAGRDSALESISWTTDIDEMSGCDLVIEAAVENLDIKTELFSALDGVLGTEAILATNTSSLPVIDVAMATSRPERVLGMHFFNPAPVMQLVEIIPTQRTAPEVTATITEFTTDALGKRVVTAPDRAGFVVNALLVPYLCQAISMYEAGHATAADIDEAMKLGAGHPMGPLTLADLIGLDVVMLAADALHDEYSERFLAPPPLLRRMVTAGHLGRKTGKGFYDYD